MYIVHEFSMWLINTSVTLYLSSLCLLFGEGIINCYCLPRFQLHNKVLPTIITVFYIIASDYIQFYRKFVFSLTPTTGNCFSTFCFKELNCNFFFPLESTSQWYYALFVFLWLISLSLTIILQGPSIFPHILRFNGWII